MRRAILAVPLLVVILAGCASPSTAPTGTPPSTPTTGAAADAPGGSAPTASATSAASAEPCRSGEGEILLASAYEGSFLPAHMRPDLVEIERDGTIRTLKGHTEPGPGEMSAEEGALDGMTLEEAAAMLARRNYTYESEHLVITRGDEGEIPAAPFASFCGSLVDALPRMRDEYPHGPGCEHALVLTWDISLASGARRISMSDCAEDAEDFETVKRDFQRLVGPG